MENNILKFWLFIQQHNLKNIILFIFDFYFQFGIKEFGIICMISCSVFYTKTDGSKISANLKNTSIRHNSTCIHVRTLWSST